MRVAILFAAALLSAAPALAAHREVRLRNDVKLQGNVIPAGEYTLQWKDEGAPEIEVTVLSGRNVVARATGSKVVLGQAPTQDAVVFQLDGAGGRELSRIVSAGRRDAIRFETTITAKTE
ncbi:MAG TPA: hypothetical protein VFV75_08435 [Candidatus Polarisedimenticolaceae bacterium]|nr:hypothetical protein [Candidatus Polarisedimenticolaceae bacterium]